MLRKTFVSLIVLLALALVVSSPAAAQGVVSWTTTMFNNGGLSGSPVVTRQDSAISFNWGSGSPANGVNSDNFSIRFGADPYLDAGTYRFYAQADDKVRVIIDFSYTAQIDTWANPAVGQLVTADITLGAGTHHVQVDYAEASGDAYVYVSWSNVATNPSGPVFNGQGGGSVPVTLTSTWTAQYFGNNSLSGAPTAIFSESSPSHNWGAGSPVVSIPSDNFSAQWSSIQTLNAGNYTLTVSADDGVRIFVDGVAVISEWHPSTGQTYSVPLSLASGTHTFVIQFYEAAGIAFLNFSLTLPGTVSQPVTNTGATITVATPRLNVRDAPDPINGRILTIVSMGDVYSLIGKNADASWFLINSPVGSGWVSARFVTPSAGANPPVVGGGGTTPQQPTSTGYVVTATPYTVNIRSGPGTQNSILAKLPLGATAVIVGRNSSSQWWQINYNGIAGWVSAVFAVIQPGANISAIPVTG